jgi:hypothetical protein
MIRNLLFVAMTCICFISSRVTASESLPSVTPVTLDGIISLRWPLLHKPRLNGDIQISRSMLTQERQMRKAIRDKKE